MTRTKYWLTALFLFAALLGPLGAQARTSLNIQSNQNGAQVYLNGSPQGYATPSFSALVTPGLYQIRLTKNGYSEFKTTVVVGQSPITIVATLTPFSPPPAPPPPPPPAPAQYQFSINSSVVGARVYLNGIYMGLTPFFSFVAPGTYSVLVSYDGYVTYEDTVRLFSPYQIYAEMAPLAYPVYINVPSIPGAGIYRDSVFMGAAPYRGTWAPGTYSIRVAAPGYADYLEKRTLSGPLTLQIALNQAFVDYEIKIPVFFSHKNGKPLQFKDFEVYLDGKRLSAPFGKTTAGSHKIVFVFDSLRFEGDFELPSGKTAYIEPYLGVSVR